MEIHEVQQLLRADAARYRAELAKIDPVAQLRRLRERLGLTEATEAPSGEQSQPR